MKHARTKSLLSALYGRFKRDDGGNVALTFSVCFLPAALVAGGAIDYSRTMTQWSNLQQATDATALTVAHAYLTSSITGDKLSTFAQTYLNGLMNGAVLNGSPVLKQSNTVVCVNTTFAVPTSIMRIVNIQQLSVATTGCAQVGQTYEVALALDNSGSMQETDSGGNSKISALKTAATSLVNILIPNGTAAPQVGISIVPFNSLVNVGTGSNNAAFMDTSGGSSTHWQNFLRPSGGTFNPTSKFDLFSGMKTSWGGCVEELSPPYTTTDTNPGNAADAKFVPYLAPDEPAALDDSNTKDSGYGTSSYSTSANVSSSYTTAQTQYFVNSYLNDNGYSTSGLGACTTSGANQTYGNADKASSNIFPNSGMTMVCKYAGTPSASTPSSIYLSSWTSEMNLYSGPNFECSSKPIQQLTTDRTALLNTINSLAAQGSTNLVSGVMWAWRSISPNVNPYPVSSPQAIGPQPPKSYTYGPPANKKVIILMTDGTNTWLPMYSTQYNAYFNSFGSLYEGFGYYANQRISSYLSKNVLSAEPCSGSIITVSNARCAMDQATMEACNNAKSSPSNVIVFTVGVQVKSGDIDSYGQSLLQGCATPPWQSHYFLVTDSASMNAAFQQIAASIISLRLTQ